MISCGAEQETSQLKVSVSSIAAAGVNMPGGMVLYGHNRTTQEKVSINFKDGQDNITLNNGSWNLFIVGWDGPNIMEGTAKCGGAFANLTGGDDEVNFSITNAKCLLPTSTESSFIDVNQFTAITIHSCTTNPGTPLVSSNCTGSEGTTNSVKVNLITDFVGNKDLLNSECIDLATGVGTLPLNLPFGGQSSSFFKTEIVAYNSAGCIGDKETFIMPVGLSDISSVILSDPANTIDLADDSSTVSIFLETTSMSLGALPFVSTWTTGSAAEDIELPLSSSGTYAFSVDWGDGSSDTINTWNDPAKVHNYTSPGTYTVTISGLITHWDATAAGTLANYNSKIDSVVDFGDMGWTNLNYAFKNCTSLISFAGGNTSSVTRAIEMFRGATALTSLDVSSWDTSNVTNMSFMFANATVANPDITSWNVGKVANMTSMLDGSGISGPNYTNFLNTISSYIPGANLSLGIVGDGSVMYDFFGISSKSTLLGWTITDGGGPIPTATSLDVSSGALVGGVTIIITGNDFEFGATVNIGGANCTALTVDSPTQITCKTGANSAGTYNVDVMNSDGMVGSGSVQFTYI